MTTSAEAYVMDEKSAVASAVVVAEVPVAAAELFVVAEQPAAVE